MTQQAQFIKAVGNANEINELLRRYGVKFGIYKNGVFNEQFFPFDPIPRVISAEDFQSMEKGLVQRVNALNEFLFDIYHEKKIVRDGIIPEDFIYISKGYLAECEGITPKNKVYSHISGIDLVQAKDGEWYILEDNLRIPSGASYPLIARDLTRIAAPQAFEENPIIDNRGYAELLKETMEHVNCGGARAILTPGRYNAAYFEHSYLAELTGSVLVQNDELFVEDNILYHRTYSGGKTRIGVLYRRIADEYLDPLTFLPESLIGIPNLMEAYRSGNVGIINAPGNGVADDKGIYYFVPKMIKYYLGEEPILKNAPTYLPFYEEDMKYVMYVCSRMVQALKKLESEGRIADGAEILVVPCVNYYSMNIGKRFWAMDNTDINRMFPGYALGETTQRIADGVFSKLQGYEYGIQLASFYQPGIFLPHVKIMDTGFTDPEIMKDFGLEFGIVRKPRPYDTTTLNYNWQVWETKAFSVYANARAMLDYVREGDTLYIESISRLGRSTKDLLNIIDTLTDKGVTLISHKENIDTDTPTGKFMLTVFAALSQLEREQLKQRQREGIEIAKAQGKYTGRKPIPTDWTRFGQLYGEWRAKNITGRDFMRRMDMSANTFYRRVREYELNHGITEPTSA